MNSVSKPGDASYLPHVHEFYLARQPILDRNQDICAYELLFRHAEVGGAEFSSDISATAAVISHTAQLGIEKVVGQAKAFVNIDAEILKSDVLEFLPREHVVLEILETVAATPEVLERVATLKKAGYTFALDDVCGDNPTLQQFLPLASIVKVDLLASSMDAIETLLPALRRAGKQVLAEKVETQEQFQRCHALGFDYFQGYYFARPSVMGGKKLSPSQLAILNLMHLLVTDAESRAIELAIKKDVSLGINLLRLVNTPAVGLRQRVDSIGHALMILGRKQLHRWLQIMLYAEPCRRSRNMTPLLLMATTRARMMELLTSKTHPHDRNVPEAAFTVGIMSLMDTLFGMPMSDLLEQVSVVDEVGEALLTRSGRLGEILTLTEYLERTDTRSELIVPLMKKLSLGDEALIDVETETYQWTDSIVRGAV